MTKKALITGSGGLIGNEAAEFLIKEGFFVVGVDNNMRAQFFGDDAGTKTLYESLKERYPKDYSHHTVDIRDEKRMNDIFSEHSFDIILHAAAQPSHEWAAHQPLTDFTVNASATMHLLEHFRLSSPGAVFIFASTNKVYGDIPNRFPLTEQETRWELKADHPCYNGIDETMSVDASMHSVFGANKLAADILVQEYGRYYGLMTVVFRCGCVSGARHRGVRLHGFLSHIARCVAADEEFTIYGYKGKQVRDIIHSSDFVSALWHYYKNPRAGEVYNIGGGRHSHVSLLEAVAGIEKRCEKKAVTSYSEQNRKGDHIWYITNMDKFRSHYPHWDYSFGLEALLDDVCSGIRG